MTRAVGGLAVSSGVLPGSGASGACHVPRGLARVVGTAAAGSSGQGCLG